MHTLNTMDLMLVSGGKALNDAEMGNAYMMATSALFAGVGTALFSNYGASIAALPLWGAIAGAGVAAVGTGLGVWVGYQLYYALNS